MSQQGKHDGPNAQMEAYARELEFRKNSTSLVRLLFGVHDLGMVAKGSMAKCIYSMHGRLEMLERALFKVQPDHEAFKDYSKERREYLTKGV